MSAPTSSRATPKGDSPTEPQIDPALADLPPPPHHPSNGSAPAHAAGTLAEAPAIVTPRDSPYPHLHGVPGEPTSITESIALAPNPHTADFSPLPFTTDDSIDVTALDDAATDEPGSPTARLLRAIAPPNAAQPNPNWPPPPPNASVNLFIGRALLSNGNDNWPLKPNDIVNWIRKHYPEEWDGDEGRCSAHRVRTYLARKGADMYYEKLNQGCIAGWRIRQNHLWRFEGGGFQGRGMKQEEAIAAQQKENELMATAQHKAAAAAALAQGHPSVKVSMSSLGDGPPNKRPRKSNGQARRKNATTLAPAADKKDEYDYAAYAQQSTYALAQAAAEAAAVPIAGPSNNINIDPALSAAVEASAAAAAADPAHVVDQSTAGDDQLDPKMVQEAMAAANAVAAAGQMDELEMGIQLPIEMQMHGGHDDDGQDDSYRYPGYDGSQSYTYTTTSGEYSSGYQQGQ